MRCLLLILVLAAPLRAVGQTEFSPAAEGTTTRPQAVDHSLFTGSSFPAVFSDLQVPGYDLVFASISFDEKAAKVSWAPFLYGTPYAAWRETRFQVAQKDGVTKAAVLFQWNPRSPRSRWGNQLFKDDVDAGRRKLLADMEYLYRELADSLKRVDRDRNSRVVPAQDRSCASTRPSPPPS